MDWCRGGRLRLRVCDVLTLRDVLVLSASALPRIAPEAPTEDEGTTGRKDEPSCRRGSSALPTYGADRAAMTFLDEAVILVTAGTGGSGCTSFRRETFVPKGGPDGGDGGRGGSIFVRADPQLSTLLDYRYRSHWRAERGQHGMGANKTGRSGEDLYLPVPPGTLIQDAESGDVLGEVIEPEEILCIARGGRGGERVSYTRPRYG